MPKVSFVVPCYKLAHLLPECLDSILRQSFKDLEVLVMDDCSPDNTREVVLSYSDSRVKYIRNEPNLGHLRNYNKGISLCKGDYIWLISADDYLRRDYVLDRYVSVMEAHPRVGYACCAGVGVKDNTETRVLDYSQYSDRDCIVKGSEFLRKLALTNIVLAAAGMVRRECYQKLGAFPLDMPFAGDWYLWALFALHYDVAFFAEPMVCYREHQLSMTSTLTSKSVHTCCEDDIAVPWAIKDHAKRSQQAEVVVHCLEAVSQVYAKSIATRRYGMQKPFLTINEFECSLAAHTSDESERQFVRARTFALAGNDFYWQGDRKAARSLYFSSLKLKPAQPVLFAKLFLLSAGKFGDSLREKFLLRLK